MFTGLVQDTAEIISVNEKQTGKTFSVKVTQNPAEFLQDVKIGDSIAVNGVCQTVESLIEDGFTFFSIPETLKITNLVSLEPSHIVNLEKAMRLSDRLGGHLVLGHIEGTCKVTRMSHHLTSQKLSENDVLDIYLESNSRYILPKGSICLNGISLTIQEVQGKIIKVQVIPETIRKTNISSWVEGTLINEESDFLVKTIDHLIQKSAVQS